MKIKLINHVFKSPYLFLCRCFIRISIDHEKNIYLFSDPRGGSTWLMEILQRSTNFPVVWEPLHNKYSPVKSLLAKRPYLPKEEHNEELKNKLINLFSGKIFNAHTLSISSVSNYLKASRLIVKFIKGNALIPWIYNNFNLSYSILLLRHPVATAISQIRAFHKQKTIPEMKSIQKSYGILYESHSNYLDKLESKLEIQVANWCLHNYLVLKDKKLKNKLLVVYYESLITNPEEEIERRCKYCAIDFKDENLRNVSKASRTDFKKEFSSDHQTQISKWINYVSKEEMDKLQSILDYFQITEYSVQSVFPVDS